MGKSIIISASDALFYPFLVGLLISIRDGARRDGLEIGVLDLGLTEQQQDDLRARGVTLCTPGLDHDPSIFRIAPPPYFRAMTARPHLPKYFPGHEVYLFLDADPCNRLPGTPALTVAHVPSMRRGRDTDR
ncbi:MAG TPA: hypothetical protein VGC39_01070 [Candidatus Methylacidiphilales bacterium]